MDYLKLYSFVDNLHELTSVSDLALTKAGASTIMELLVTGTIPIVSRYIWGQEKGNKDFIIDNNLGFYERRPWEIAGLVISIFSDEEMMDKIRMNIDRMNICSGTEQVAEYISL